MDTKFISTRTVTIDLQGRTYALPVLRRLTEIQIPKIYFHIEHGFEEFEHFSPFLKNIDGIELKAYGFKKEHDQALFIWPHDVFRPVPSNFLRLNNICREYGLDVQFHLPITIKRGAQPLSLLNRRDHEPILHMLEVYAELISRNNYGSNINMTLHPPYMVNAPFPKDTSQITNEFLIRASEVIEKEKWPMTLCIENMPSPSSNIKTPTSKDHFGHTAAQFESMLIGTGARIQAVMDTGHLNISPLLTTQDMERICLAHGKHIANIHLHGNYGIAEEILEQNGHTDLHLLPEPGTTPEDIEYYLLRAILDGSIVNYEVKISDRETERSGEILRISAHIEQTRKLLQTLHALVLQAIK